MILSVLPFRLHYLLSSIQHGLAFLSLLVVLGEHVLDPMVISCCHLNFFLILGDEVASLDESLDLELPYSLEVFDKYL